MGDDAPSYEEWERYCFTQGEADFAECAEDDMAYDRHEHFTTFDSATLIEFLVRLFADESHIIERYTTRQLADGIRFVFGYGSESMFEFVYADASAKDIKRRFRAVGDLYERVFERVCLVDWTPMSDDSGGAGSQADDAIDSAVYMIWDMGGIELALCNSTHLVVDASYALLDRILRRCTKPACLYSALHALGHEVGGGGLRARRRIDRFLEVPGLPNHVVEYARSARTGSIQ